MFAQRDSVHEIERGMTRKSIMQEIDKAKAPIFHAIEGHSSRRKSLTNDGNTNAIEPVNMAMLAQLGEEEHKAVASFNSSVRSRRSCTGVPTRSGRPTWNAAEITKEFSSDLGGGGTESTNGHDGGPGSEARQRRRKSAVSTFLGCGEAVALSKKRGTMPSSAILAQMQLSVGGPGGVGRMESAQSMDRRSLALNACESIGLSPAMAEKLTRQSLAEVGSGARMADPRKSVADIPIGESVALGLMAKVSGIPDEGDDAAADADAPMGDLPRCEVDIRKPYSYQQAIDMMEYFARTPLNSKQKRVLLLMVPGRAWDQTWRFECSGDGCAGCLLVCGGPWISSLYTRVPFFPGTAGVWPYPLRIWKSLIRHMEMLIRGFAAGYGNAHP